MKLVIGSIAPDFTATGNDGSPVRLSAVLDGKKAVFLVLLRGFG